MCFCLCSMLICGSICIPYFLSLQTVVDELSVCTINLENDPTYEDLSSSNECEFVIAISSRIVIRHRTQMSSNNIAKSILEFFNYKVSDPISDYGFDGYQNSINLLREYYQQYACEFALTYYPFDTQVCHMVFALQVIPWIGTATLLTISYFPSTNFQGFTKEFIVLKQDYIGVNYTGF